VHCARDASDAEPDEEKEEKEEKEHGRNATWRRILPLVADHPSLV